VSQPVSAWKNGKPCAKSRTSRWSCIVYKAYIAQEWEWKIGTEEYYWTPNWTTLSAIPACFQMRMQEWSCSGWWYGVTLALLPGKHFKTCFVHGKRCRSPVGYDDYT
jgi:hypothetical protein